MAHVWARLITSAGPRAGGSWQHPRKLELAQAGGAGGGAPTAHRCCAGGAAPRVALFLGSEWPSSRTLTPTDLLM